MTEWFEPTDRGRSFNSTLNSVYSKLRDYRRDPEGYKVISDWGRDDKWVMGFALPDFQRDNVWTDEQNIAFINSARRKLPLGTFTYNVTYDVPSAKRVDANGRTFFYADMWLIDGLQRMTALQKWFDDEFPVEGSYWSELDKTTRLMFLQNNHFNSYETKLTDEHSLRLIYDNMNFGGTAHKEHERALPISLPKL
jgi:hypothetical protein